MLKTSIRITALLMGELPPDEAAALQTLAIPVYPELTGEQIEYVVRAVADFHA